MRCPYCSHEETQVVETRESDEGDALALLGPDDEFIAWRDARKGYIENGSPVHLALN